MSSPSILTSADIRPASDDLDSLLSAVTDAVENYLGQPVMPRTVVHTVDAYDTGTVMLPGRVASVTSIVTSGGQAVTDYTVNAAAGLITGHLRGATITYVAGFDPVPEAIRLATLYAVQHAQESDAGAVVNGQAAGDEVFTISRGFFLPNRSKELLDPYRFPQGLA